MCARYLCGICSQMTAIRLCVCVCVCLSGISQNFRMVYEFTAAYRFGRAPTFNAHQNATHVNRRVSIPRKCMCMMDATNTNNSVPVRRENILYIINQKNAPPFLCSTCPLKQKLLMVQYYNFFDFIRFRMYVYILVAYIFRALRTEKFSFSK